MCSEVGWRNLHALPVVDKYVRVSRSLSANRSLPVCAIFNIAVIFIHPLVGWWLAPVVSFTRLFINGFLFGMACFFNLVLWLVTMGCIVPLCGLASALDSPDVLIVADSDYFSDIPI